MFENSKPDFETQAEARRSELIQATLQCIVKGGLHSTTVRNVAIQAGVTNGLIRHYFSTKGNLIQQAYRTMIQEMNQPAKEAVLIACESPKKRLVSFISANLTPPVLDTKRLCLWASFISLIHVDEAIAKIHSEGYSDFRAAIVPVILDLFANEGTPIETEIANRYAVKVNSIIDGLWLEGCLDPDSFDLDGLSDIGIEAVEAMLGINLQD